MITGSVKVDLPAGIQDGALVGALVVNVLAMEPAQQFSLDRNRLLQSQRLFAVETTIPDDSVEGIFRPETRRSEIRSHRRKDMRVLLLREQRSISRQTRIQP